MTLLCCLLLAPPLAAATGKSAAPATKKKTVATSAQKKKASSRAASAKKTKASAKNTRTGAKAKAEAPAEEAAPVLPAPEVIPDAIVNALADGDLNRAIILMREEKPSPKLSYLLHEATVIAAAEQQKRPPKSEAHKLYQNVAIAYHNLYLFLRAQGINQPAFVKEARSHYRKARSAATQMHKSECDLLTAALLASSGEREKAEKLMRKVDVASLRGDFESTEYLAAYRAAAGDHAGALESLESAYRMNPERTLTWLAISDDFADLKDDPTYQALIATWHVSARKKELTLSLPKSPEPKLDTSGIEGGFAPQKMMVHVRKKEASKARSKKDVRGSASRGSSKAKASSSGSAKSSKQASTSSKKTSSTTAAAGAKRSATSTKQKR